MLPTLDPVYTEANACIDSCNKIKKAIIFLSIIIVYGLTSYKELHRVRSFLYLISMMCLIISSTIETLICKEQSVVNLYLVELIQQ
jgi:ABC-type multidrug transport system permease subunit